MAAMLFFLLLARSLWLQVAMCKLFHAEFVICVHGVRIMLFGVASFTGADSSALIISVSERVSRPIYEKHRHHCPVDDRLNVNKHCKQSNLPKMFEY